MNKKTQTCKDVYAHLDSTINLHMLCVCLCVYTSMYMHIYAPLYPPMNLLFLRYTAKSAAGISEFPPNT